MFERIPMEQVKRIAVRQKVSLYLLEEILLHLKTKIRRTGQKLFQK